MWSAKFAAPKIPNKIIVVGGHLDSWDLASGTTDNGCGTAVTLGAAEAIIKSGFKPRRTIRFVLFTGEEQGLLGSLAYVKAHQSEMPNYVAALILDAGQGAVTGFQLGGRDDLIPTFQKFAASLQAFGDLQVDDEVEFGTDTGPFTLAGLPAINLNQDTADYKYTHHSAVDTFDKVKADVLDRNATVMALAAFWIADRPERLASSLAAGKNRSDASGQTRGRHPESVRSLAVRQSGHAACNSVATDCQLHFSRGYGRCL